ncbi:tetratricopeptide repeat protein [Candidatus Neomarinimicrobiota bacterium]
MVKNRLSFKLFLVVVSAFIVSMCVPPSGPSAEDIANKARIDSIKNVRCPRLMSSAAEYYHARDWEATVSVYSEVVDLGCDEWDATFAPPEEIYQYYGIAYEQMGKYDSSEYVLLKGVEKIPNNIDLRIRLAYAYKRQGKTDQEIVEYERILDELDPQNVRVITELASLYRKEGRYEEQIRVLQKLIDIDPTNEAAIADLATAFERTGKDPLELYLDKYNNNPSGTNGIQLADAYMQNNRISEAIDVLKAISRKEPNDKIIFIKLGDAYILNEDFSNASIALEQAYKLDTRDNQTAIRICEVNSELENFSKAMSWADKAINGSKSSGEALGAKGDVYYKAFHTCRTPEVSSDDRIIARLAYKYYIQAESAGYRNITGSKNWLRDNEVLFTKSDWFMLDASQKAAGYATVKTSCYSWVTERLYKDSDW